MGFLPSASHAIQKHGFELLTKATQGESNLRERRCPGVQRKKDNQEIVIPDLIGNPWMPGHARHDETG
jgi:hypothetical protein